MSLFREVGEVPDEVPYSDALYLCIFIHIIIDEFTYQMSIIVGHAKKRPRDDIFNIIIHKLIFIIIIIIIILLYLLFF